MSGNALRYGLYFPPFDVLADPAVVAGLGADAERAGWDGVFIWDHLLYTEPVRDIADPWICLAAVATATRGIRLGPMVTPLARRRPAVVARQAATLDRLSGGRLILGFGLGDDGAGELSRFGEETDPVARGQALTEALQVTAALLTGREVRHNGARYTADRVSFRPAPVQDTACGGIPIWLGGRWPRQAPLRRAAGYHGVFTIGIPGPGELKSWCAAIGSMGARHGYDVVVTGRPGDDPAPWAAAGATWWLVQFGPYHLDLDQVRAFITAGPPRGDSS